MLRGDFLGVDEPVVVAPLVGEAVAGVPLDAVVVVDGG